MSRTSALQLSGDVGLFVCAHAEKATSSSEKLLRALDIGMTQDSVLPQLGKDHPEIFELTNGIVVHIATYCSVLKTWMECN